MSLGVGHGKDWLRGAAPSSGKTGSKASTEVRDVAPPVLLACAHSHAFCVSHALGRGSRASAEVALALHTSLACICRHLACMGAWPALAGCGTNLVRTTPAAALTFTSFELIARGLRQVRQGWCRCIYCLQLCLLKRQRPCFLCG